MEERLKNIHQASMRILGKTGMKFHHHDALQILSDHGIHVEDNIAYFTEEELLFWVKKAPHSFKLYARNSEHHVMLGGDCRNPAPGYGASMIMEKDGVRRRAHLDDFIKMARLYHVTSTFHINGGVLVQPEEISPENAVLLMFFAAYLQSDKCMMAGSGDREQMEALMEMAMVVFGGRQELYARPRLLTIVNTNTPLQLDKSMTDTLLTFGAYGQPVAVTAGAMAGSTAPVTLAGTLAVANAEILATIALSQMANPGTPVLYATQCETSDMRNGSAAIGSPEGALCYQYSALLAKFYNLPCRGGGCVTDAKTADAQAGFESMMSSLVANLNNVNLMIHSAGILDSYACMSYEKLVVDFQIIDYVNRFMRGFEISEETIPEDVINEVGQSGQYLTQEHTLEFCRREPLIPKISVRGSTLDNKHQLDANIEKEINRMLESYIKPESEQENIDEMKEILRKRGVDELLIQRIEEM